MFNSPQFSPHHSRPLTNSKGVIETCSIEVSMGLFGQYIFHIAKLSLMKVNENRGENVGTSELPQ